MGGWRSAAFVLLIAVPWSTAAHWGCAYVTTGPPWAPARLLTAVFLSGFAFLSSEAAREGNGRPMASVGSAALTGLFFSMHVYVFFFVCAVVPALITATSVHLLSTSCSEAIVRLVAHVSSPHAAQAVAGAGANAVVVGTLSSACFAFCMADESLRRLLVDRLMEAKLCAFSSEGSGPKASTAMAALLAYDVNALMFVAVVAQPPTPLAEAGRVLITLIVAAMPISLLTCQAFVSSSPAL